MSIRAALDLDAEPNPLLVGSLGLDLAQHVAVAKQHQTLLLHRRQQPQVVLHNLPGGDAVVWPVPGRRPPVLGGALLVAFPLRVHVLGKLRLDLLLERGAAPPALPVEAEPLTNLVPVDVLVICLFLDQRMQRKQGRRQDRVVRTDEHVVGELAWRGFVSTDLRCRAEGVVLRLELRVIPGHDDPARLDAHVTVLAGDAFLGRRRVLVLAERLLEPKPIGQRNVVTAATMARRPQLEKLVDFLVNGLTPALLDRVLQLGVVALGAVHRLLDIALDDREPSADLAVRLVDAVADNARDAFA